MSKNSVSIIMTIYGIRPNPLMERVCLSIKEQTIPCEIVFAEQSLEPNKETIDFCKNNGLKYVFSQATLVNKKPKFNIGKVRNDAAKAAVGDYLYFNDTDVEILSTTYIQTLLHYHKNINPLTLIRPKTMRLVAASIPLYINAQKIQLDAQYHCFVQFDPKVSSLKPYRLHERYALINNMLHVEKDTINSKKVYNPADFDTFNWAVTCHYGGLFCKKSDFVEIGGYCEEYFTWGMEDSDIQWKFDMTCGIQLIDNVISDVSLLHFEHPSRCDNKDYSKNYKVFQCRKEKEISEVLRIDKNNFEREKK